MKKLVAILAAALLLLVLGTNAAFAQAGDGTVSGKAVRWNGDPISGATIRALAGPLETDKEIARTTTGADGSYSLAVPAGQPYWIHIDTFGTWWGYSYQTPFTLRPGEGISQVYFALGPRDVKEITLPAPISNVGPETGQNQQPQNPPPAAPPVAPPAAPPVAPPAAPPVEKPVSNVKPEVGYNSGANTAKPVQRTAPQTVARVLPRTGASSYDYLWLAFAGALALSVLGLTVRRQALRRR